MSGRLSTVDGLQRAGLSKDTTGEANATPASPTAANRTGAAAATSHADDPTDDSANTANRVCLPLLRRRWRHVHDARRELLHPVGGRRRHDGRPMWSEPPSR